MTQKVTRKTAAESVSESRTALAGIKEGALAAKKAVANIASLPRKALDKAVYGTCYGLSYGAVFTSLVVVKLLPSDSVAMKGFHEGAEDAHKDFIAQEQEAAATIDATAVSQ